ncbi:FtsH protease activity modulator HflK [Aquabacterium sp.]|uniref:FtsH protease activity modulator HflK n=1 Tax=Aquabacterium sp. TaxID=1872578 RepID=UPI0035B29721
MLNNDGRNNGGPPDLDELWRDFNRKLSQLFSGPPVNAGGDGPSSPDMRGAGGGLGFFVGLLLLIWLGSGFFIVQEGQQAVVMSFGRFSRTAEAGFQWRMPYPFESHEIVDVTRLRTVEVGSAAVAQSTGLRDSSMLTQDENIVDIRFTVQYRLKDPRAFLFENHDPEAAVVQAAESAVREIVGRSSMDSVLYQQRDALAVDLVKLIQSQLDRLKAGVLIANVNVQSVQAPEQVQAAFDDAFKAGADRERFKNDGQAYANDVIPKARGTAARLHEEAEAYRAKVVARAEGDSQRFRSVLAEYQKAPAVTRDRIYIDTMQQIYSSVTKILVDSRAGSNLLYLPLDRLLQQAGAGQSSGVSAPVASASAPTAPGQVVPEVAAAPSTATDSRSRDNARGRDREGR